MTDYTKGGKIENVRMLGPTPDGGQERFTPGQLSAPMAPGFTVISPPVDCASEVMAQTVRADIAIATLRKIMQSPTFEGPHLAAEALRRLGER